MKKFLSLSIRTHLVILLLLLGFPLLCVIGYSGAVERKEAINAAKEECLKFVDTLATEQQAVVAGAQQLATTLKSSS